MQSLRTWITKLQKQKFGARSEKIEHEIEQLELALKDLIVARAEADDAPLDEDETTEQDLPADEGETPPEKKPRRRPKVSKDTPRERRELDPGDAYPDCHAGGMLPA